MSQVFEALGLTLAEVVGAAIVIGGIIGAVFLFREFGNTFIGYFM